MPLAPARSVNFAVRFSLGLYALAAPGYWGFVVEGSPITKVILGLGFPLLAAVVWGTFVAPKAAIPLSTPLRLLPESLVFGSATAALHGSGHPLLAVCFISLALANRVLVLAWEWARCAASRPGAGSVETAINDFVQIKARG